MSEGSDHVNREATQPLTSESLYRSGVVPSPTFPPSAAAPWGFGVAAATMIHKNSSSDGGGVLVRR